MFDTWYPLAGIALGAVAIVQGLLFRAGRSRRSAAWYWQEDAPFYYRNAPFAMVPIGLVFVTGSLAGAAVSSDSRGVRALGWLLAAAAAASAAAWVLVAYRPPAFLKPDWLRREEAVRGLPRPRRGAWSAFERVIVGFVLAVMTIGFVGALWGAASTAG